MGRIRIVPRVSSKENKNIYFKQREKLGLTRETASDLLETIAPERIEKIENERCEPHPDEVLVMSEKYKSPELCNYYCSNQCPIGRQYVPEVKIQNLSQIVLRLVDSLNTVQDNQRRLIGITADGTIDDSEINDFVDIQNALEKISITVEALLCYVFYLTCYLFSSQILLYMAFKYLYCICDRCRGGEKYKKKFDKCHMPLDSFSLEWFKRKFKEDDFSNAESYPENYKKLPENLFTKGEKKKLKAESIGSWSSMQRTWEKSCIKEEYPYEFYAHVIKQYCKENSITPLQLDFIVWSKMQKIMAAESFIKTFKDDDKENKEAINSEEQEPYDIPNLKTTLENRLSEIRPLICK